MTEQNETRSRDELETRAKELGVTEPQALTDEELRTEVETREANQTDGTADESDSEDAER
jgi:hypothetical protein